MAVPQRIVCLSAEAADWLWRIGAWDQVAGVSSFFKRPKDLKAKPCVGGFSTARISQVENLNPDLIITFSDVQIPFTAELIRRGFPVLATNQRTLREIENTLAMLASIVGHEEEGKRLLKYFEKCLSPLKKAARLPRVYFEEWNEPLVTGISWISELIERAGGKDIFQHLRNKKAACERIVPPDEIMRHNPQIIFASWCGRPVRIGEIKNRTGWSELAAIENNQVFEVAAEDILQPGYRLVYGYEKIKQLIDSLR
jgi:iron complex transport system substrate-binding protein